MRTNLLFTLLIVTFGNCAKHKFNNMRVVASVYDYADSLEYIKLPLMEMQWASDTPGRWAYFWAYTIRKYKNRAKNRDSFIYVRGKSINSKLLFHLNEYKRVKYMDDPTFYKQSELCHQMTGLKKLYELNVTVDTFSSNLARQLNNRMERLSVQCLYLDTNIFADSSILNLNYFSLFSINKYILAKLNSLPNLEHFECGIFFKDSLLIDTLLSNPRFQGRREPFQRKVDVYVSSEELMNITYAELQHLYKKCHITFLIKSKKDLQLVEEYFNGYRLYFRSYPVQYHRILEYLGYRYLGYIFISYWE